MSNERKVDKSKKSNIKCEHCKYLNCEKLVSVFVISHIESKPVCDLTEKPKDYRNRCKNFEWAERYNDSD